MNAKSGNHYQHPYLYDKFERSQALKQPGYISGETLVNHYDPSNITVISTWQTIDDWIRWQESDERAVQEDHLENLQEGPANFEIYDLGPASRD